MLGKARSIDGAIVNYEDPSLTPEGNAKLCEQVAQELHKAIP